jgi:hypothetical protein
MRINNNVSRNVCTDLLTLSLPSIAQLQGSSMHVSLLRSICCLYDYCC